MIQGAASPANPWKTARKLPEATGKTVRKLPANPWKTVRKLPEATGKTAGKPLENWLKTVGKIAGKRVSNRWKTAGKLAENRWETSWKTAGKPASNCRETGWKTVGKPPGTTGKTAGKRASNRWENRRKPPEDHWQKLSENRPETAGKSPLFGSLLPVSISNRNGWKGSLRRHFSAPGGGCHKEPTFQAQLMYFSKRWGWRNGDLWVFRRDGGPSRSDDAKIGISL